MTTPDTGPFRATDLRAIRKQLRKAMRQVRDAGQPLRLVHVPDAEGVSTEICRESLKQAALSVLDAAQSCLALYNGKSVDARPSAPAVDVVCRHHERVQRGFDRGWELMEMAGPARGCPDGASLVFTRESLLAVVGDPRIVVGCVCHTDLDEVS